jgi:phosphoserine phosphatase RsbU/P
MSDKVEEERTYRVLLLDDERVIRLAIRAYLLGTEFTLTSVATAPEALVALRHTNYDVVISDIVMKPMDGFEFREQMRIYAPELPIIFMTSAENTTDNKLFAQIMDDLFSYYLPKCGQAKFLLQKLRQVTRSFDALKLSRSQTAHMLRNQSFAGLVQQSLMPPWAHIGNGYEYSYFYSPLSRVSGDLLEFFTVGPKKILMFFGDISGHGTHAGLVMAALQTFMHQTVNAGNASRPETIARMVNRFLCTNFSGMLYTCAHICYWDFENNFLRKLCCGMPDMLCMLHPGQELCRINTDGHGALPLGMAPDTVYSTSECIEYHFYDDSLFFAYTDGMLDQSRDSEGNYNLTTNIFQAIVRDAAYRGDNTVWSMPSRIYDAIIRRGFRHAQDDCTMLVIRKETDDEAKHFIRLIPADSEELDRNVQETANNLKEQGFSEKTCTETELLLSEFLTNILKHGLRNQTIRNDYTVMQVDCLEDNEIQICIWERGRAWGQDLKNYGVDDADRKLDELSANFSSNGRGIPILRKVATSIAVRNWCGINKTIFKIPGTKA